jgi:hypothetical protein
LTYVKGKLGKRCTLLGFRPMFNQLEVIVIEGKSPQFTRSSLDTKPGLPLQPNEPFSFLCQVMIRIFGMTTREATLATESRSTHVRLPCTHPRLPVGASDAAPKGGPNLSSTPKFVLLSCRGRSLVARHPHRLSPSVQVKHNEHIDASACY